MKTYRSLSEIQKALADGETTLPALVEGYIRTIDETKSLNIFLETFAAESSQKAKEIQEKIGKGTAGSLAGAVIAIKDNLCYAGHKVGAASQILNGFESLYSATAVDRLLKEDAIVIGRVNCDEFAMGGSNENSSFGPVLNPLNREYVPGGSSGGSAAAVAANCCLVALGSDTGGSIRQPASFCGVVGVKPTYGRVSRHGLIAFASSFDQIGPLAHTVEDASKVLEIMAGKDGMDTTSSSVDVDTYTAFDTSEGKKKIGYIDDCLTHEAIDPDVAARHKELIEKLRAAGHTVEAVHLEELKYLVPAYYVLTTAEASSNLSRYDGIHYGYRSGEATDIESTYTKSRTEGFGDEVKRRIILGTFVLSSGYYDAYYSKAQKVRRIIRDKTENLLKSYDFLMSPTTPSSAFKLGANTDDPIKMYLEDIFTVHANLAGTPAVSLPLFKHRDHGMPFGVQFMAAPFKEKALMNFAHNLMNTPSLKE